MLRRLLAAGACACVVSACVSKDVPYIRQPTRIEAFCSNTAKRARPTAIASSMTSTDDRVLDLRPTEADVRRETSAGDGAIAYWTEQPLALPRVSVLLGETDGYVRVKAAAVAPHPDGSETRPIFMLMRDRGTYRWYAMKAYDLEDVCVEGKPQT